VRITSSALRQRWLRLLSNITKAHLLLRCARTACHGFYALRVIASCEVGADDDQTTIAGDVICALVDAGTTMFVFCRSSP
jgi:hypothetical protein